MKFFARPVSQQPDERTGALAFDDVPLALMRKAGALMVSVTRSCKSSISAHLVSTPVPGADNNPGSGAGEAVARPILPLQSQEYCMAVFTNGDNSVVERQQL